MRRAFDFLVHAVEHLADRVDLHVALFVALERKANREMFGELDEHGLIGLGVGRVRRQFGERRFQRVLRAAGQLRHLLVECARRGHAAAATRADLADAGQRAENAEDFFFGGFAPERPARTRTRLRARCRNRSVRCQARKQRWRNFGDGTAEEIRVGARGVAFAQELLALSRTLAIVEAGARARVPPSLPAIRSPAPAQCPARRRSRHSRARRPPLPLPLFAPCAAAIISSNFCGSLSHCLN